MLEDLEPGALTRILRPTVIVSLGVGVVGAGIAIWLSSPFAALGIALGIAAAILNVRVLGTGVLSAQTQDTSDGKVIRKLLQSNSAIRLVVITAAVIGLVVVIPPLGIGAMIGLVIFQIAFVVNAGRAIMATRAL
ncbi:MAG: hypothetical protein WCI29_02800 [Actinomycetes bacterium]